MKILLPLRDGVPFFSPAGWSQPACYGLCTLAATIIARIEWIATSIFARQLNFSAWRVRFGTRWRDCTAAVFDGERKCGTLAG